MVSPTTLLACIVASSKFSNAIAWHKVVPSWFFFDMRTLIVTVLISLSVSLMSQVQGRPLFVKGN